MSHRADVLDRSVPQEGGKSPVRGRIPILVLWLTALGLIALAVLAPVGQPAMLAQDAHSRLAANPELLVVRHYAASGPSEASILAANPELILARRYPISEPSESAILAANPELVLARRYDVSEPSESAILAANPELILARRYARPSLSEDSLFAANPELRIFRYYGGALPDNAQARAPASKQ